MCASQVIVEQPTSSILWNFPRMAEAAVTLKRDMVSCEQHSYFQNLADLGKPLGRDKAMQHGARDLFTQVWVSTAMAAFGASTSKGMKLYGTFPLLGGIQTKACTMALLLQRATIATGTVHSFTFVGLERPLPARGLEILGKEGVNSDSQSPIPDKWTNKTTTDGVWSPLRFGSRGDWGSAVES